MQPRVVLVGGFLGAGKTTLVTEMVRRLSGRGRRVGVITNDQAANLVDTGLVGSKTAGVGEVAGACFCCSFDTFISELKRLNSQLNAEVLVGEPVGSCTDLSATVVNPLNRYYAESFHMAPYSVLVDPVRFRESLAPRGQGKFPDSVLYIYRLQIEEADAIVLNKSDLLLPGELAMLQAELRRRYPGRPVFAISALTGQGVDEWLAYVLGGSASGQRIAEVDYDLYAEGEAALGWLNAAVQLASGSSMPWQEFCRSLLEELRTRLTAANAEIAHAKVLLTAEAGWVAANLTGSTGEPSVRGEVKPSPAASLIVNVRAHIAPAALKGIVLASLRTASGETIRETISEIRSLSPGRPKPTHRFSEVA